MWRWRWGADVEGVEVKEGEEVVEEGEEVVISHIRQIQDSCC